MRRRRRVKMADSKIPFSELIDFAGPLGATLTPSEGGRREGKSGE